MEFCELTVNCPKLKFYTLNCAIVVGWLAGKLFVKCPSITESSKCNKGCPVLDKALPVKQMAMDIVINENAFSLMADDCILSGYQSCRYTNCQGRQKSVLAKIGKVFKLLREIMLLCNTPLILQDQYL